MAIIKNITLDSGVAVNYHRVVSVHNVTNVSSIIEVASYTDKSKREEEKQAIANSQPMNVFINSKYLSVPYDPTLNVNSAYEYLKATETYSNGTDDLD